MRSLLVNIGTEKNANSWVIADFLMIVLCRSGTVKGAVQWFPITGTVLARARRIPYVDPDIPTKKVAPVISIERLGL